MSIFKKKDPSQLAKQLEEFQKKGGFESDASEWKLSQDKQGNGGAVVRFLPAKTETSTSFVKLVNHGFQRNGKWFIENCPSTLGNHGYDLCPVCDHIKAQNWDYNVEADKKAMYASGLTRKTAFWANILVVKDPANPDNEGKVFKWRFGKKIMDKIMSLASGDEELGQESVDVTCPIDGANFAVKIKKVGGNNNYDDSTFLKQSAIPNIEDEKYQVQLAEGMHDLQTLIAADQFKSKDDLTKRFNMVMGTRQAASKAADDFEDELNQYESEKQSGKSDSDSDDLPAKSSSSSISRSSDIDDELEALLDDL